MGSLPFVNSTKMVNSISFRRLSSILSSYFNCNKNSDMKSQIIPSSEHKIHGIVPCDTIIVANNNYLTGSSSVVPYCSDSNLSRWSSSSNWTRKAPLIPDELNLSSTTIYNSHSHSWKWRCVSVGAIVAILICLVIGGTLLLKYLYSPTNNLGNITSQNTSTKSFAKAIPTTLSPVQLKQKKADISRELWMALQNNQFRHSEKSSSSTSRETNEFPTIFSMSKDKVLRIPCGTSSPTRTECCKLQKSTVILDFPGCSPLEVPKHECFGGCNHVYIEGIFESVPKCQPVGIQRRKFMLNCGGKMKPTSIDVITRCACA